MAKGRKPQVVMETHIEIAASPTVLWTCFTDLGKWPRWFPALDEAEWIAGTPWTTGAQFRQSIRWGFLIGSVTGEATITEIAPSTIVTWKSELAMVEMVHTFRFDSTASGTEVTGRHEFYSRMMWLARLLFLPRRAHEAYQEALSGLKTYVETGKV